MTTQEIGVGARVRLTQDCRARRLWGLRSDADATIREAKLVDNGSGAMCVRVNVDGDRRSRIRTMRLDYLDVAQ